MQEKEDNHEYKHRTPSWFRTEHARPALAFDLACHLKGICAKLKQLRQQEYRQAQQCRSYRSSAARWGLPSHPRRSNDADQRAAIVKAQVPVDNSFPYRSVGDSEVTTFCDGIYKFYELQAKQGARRAPLLPTGLAIRRWSRLTRCSLRDVFWCRDHRRTGGIFQNAKASGDMRIVSAAFRGFLIFGYASFSACPTMP